MGFTVAAMDEGNHDFEFAQRGLLELVKEPLIYSDSTPHNVIWDTSAYDFLQSDCPQTANKMLWRQGQLCTVPAGLYQVTDGVYQVRGLDISNMNIIQIPKTNGIIVVDCLTSVETARRAIDLYLAYHKKTYGQAAEIKALIYTHSHGDHFGGATAITEKASKDIPIIGPDGFLEHAVSENIYAGGAMARRAIYMYGEGLDKSPTGQIGAGLGQALSTGASTIIAPTQNIKQDGPLLPAIEGIQIQCQLTPGTEAPAEVNFFFPDYSALCMAENATHTLHNLQTLRGAQVRDARMWYRYLDEAIALYADKSDVVFSSHHWPTWNDGDEKLVVAYLEQQRDFYAYLHNESLRRLNSGETPREISENITVPPSLAKLTNLRGYYGSVSHNVKAVYDKYLGWFDGNPANLWPLTPVDEATEYVKCIGGSDAALQKAKDYHANGNLRFAATLLNNIIFADSGNKDAKDELVSVYTTLGQGAENGIWRNIYLTGAQELQSGSQKPVVLTPDSLTALSLDELFDVLSIAVDGTKAGLTKGVTIEFMVQDMPVKQKATPVGWHLRLSNGAVTGRGVQYSAAPTPRDSSVVLTVWLSHQDLVTLIATAASTAPTSLDNFTTSGDVAAWQTIASLVAASNPGFNIVTP